MLSVVSQALHNVFLSYRYNAQKRASAEERQRKLEDEKKRHQIRVKDGTWHDGRLDCVSGNGIISELGIGDEFWDSESVITDSVLTDIKQNPLHEKQFEAREKKKTGIDAEADSALPIVVIRNFESKATGGMSRTNSREDILNVLANWAGSLAENQIAHVIVISDNRENVKKLSRGESSKLIIVVPAYGSKALGPKPLISIALFDADPATSLAFVKQKLKDAGVDLHFTGDEAQHLQRLGGRASELESVSPRVSSSEKTSCNKKQMILKVRNGQTIQQAVEEIITRAVGELRKNAFGDDTDDIKGKPWTREQAWKLVKMLSVKPEVRAICLIDNMDDSLRNKNQVSYFDILMEFPFKGDENALRAMESAEIISIGSQDDRPSTIRPGKPVYRWAFERLVNDAVFRAVQEITINEKQIANWEGMIQRCEDELQRLRNVEELDGGWFRWLMGGRADVWGRERFLLRKLGDANRKIEELDRMNRGLKTIIRKN